jgi:hypothetical protein
MIFFFFKKKNNKNFCKKYVNATRVRMDTKIPQEELDALIGAKRENDIRKEKGENLERLLGDMMGTVTGEGAAARPDAQESPQKLTWRLKSYALTLIFVFMVGSLCGSSFGFYLGRTKRHAPALDEVEAKMMLLVRQIQEIYDKLNPSSPPEETIEPLAPSKEWEKLAPKEKS